MKYELIIFCNSCANDNKHHWDEKGYELKTVEFESFSEAHKHIIENPEHYMSINVRETSEEALKREKAYDKP